MVLSNELKKTDCLPTDTGLKATTKRITRRNSENTKKLKKSNSSEETVQAAEKIVIKTRRKAVLLQQQQNRVPSSENLETEEIPSMIVPPSKQSLPRKTKVKEPRFKSPPKEPKQTAAKKPKLTQSTLYFPSVTSKNYTKNNNENTTSTPANPNGLNTFACLRNLGSTCYINCIIQVMRYTPGFVASIHRLNKQIDYLESLVKLEFIFIRVSSKFNYFL